ncbi:hypothetical protein GCM10022215_27100 [Nocardioides fonticola]|uniref:Uncharacterized protein n=1 Tax=Nocardioides fonticola TaxID=450363 RepID=A0ABP7XLZ5_9ACTN
MGESTSKDPGPNPVPTPRAPVRGELARSIRIKPSVPRVVWAAPVIALAAAVAVVAVALSEHPPPDPSRYSDPTITRGTP